MLRDSPDALLARADARWRQVQTSQPALAPAIELQRRLIERQIALLGSPELETLLVDLPSQTAAAEAIAADVPVLAGVRLEVPASVTRELPAFAEDAGRGGAGEAGRKIARLLAADAAVAQALARASFARDEDEVHALASAHGVNVQVLWFVGGLATAPVAHRMQVRLLETSQDPVAGALEAVAHGSCPACGSWPAVAEFFSSERLLRCDYCAARWRPPIRRCVYCDEAGEPFRTIVPDPAAPGRRLELCGTCGGYLKTLDVPVPTPFPLLAIEDLASNDLDRMAMHHGFRRQARRDRRTG